MRTYKVFISHSWTYLDDLKNLRNLLKQRGYFDVEFLEASPDVRVNSSDANYIKRKLKQNITDADVVLGIAGKYASYSDWIEWEIETAYSLSKPIIGIIPRGASQISSVVDRRSRTNLRWNTESIISAIRTYA